jgi:hypothetical protein
MTRWNSVPAHLRSQIQRPGRRVVLPAGEAAVERTRRSKFNNRKVVFGGITFDSQREFARYLELSELLERGRITQLKVHPRYSIVINQVRVCGYEPDFEYYVDGKLIVEDVKSKPTRTRVYMLKRKLMRAVHGIEIQET